MLSTRLESGTQVPPIEVVDLEDKEETLRWTGAQRENLFERARRTGVELVAESHGAPALRAEP